MSLTLLIDLDDTLIGNQMDRFLPAYFQKLAAFMGRLTNPELVIPNLMAATQKAMIDQNPFSTIKEVFDQHFYPVVGVSHDEAAPHLEEFYRDIYPELQSVIELRPEACELMDEAFRRGYQVVVATNPLFPASAVYQRLAWGGLSRDNYPYSLITSYEKSHFAKPNPAYYAEILAGLGWPTGPVIMAGNDPQQDIVGAAQLGLATYWVETDQIMGEPVDPEAVKPSARGDLRGLLPWIDSCPEDSLLPDYSSASATMAMIQGVAAMFKTLADQVPSDLWNHHPGNGEWSLKEIYGHLRDVETRVNLPRLKQILSEDSPFIPGIDTDAWYQTQNYLAEDTDQVLQTYFDARWEVIQMLLQMSAPDWDREARHAIFGPTRLKEMVHIMAEHDLLHLGQIQQILSVAANNR